MSHGERREVVRRLHPILGHSEGSTLDRSAEAGVGLSFRAWDGQLRQPLLLSDGQSVVAMAPVDGILHPKNALDTLGADAPEKLCKAR